MERIICETYDIFNIARDFNYTMQYVKKTPCSLKVYKELFNNSSEHFNDISIYIDTSLNICACCVGIISIDIDKTIKTFKSKFSNFNFNKNKHKNLFSNVLIAFMRNFDDNYIIDDIINDIINDMDYYEYMCLKINSYFNINICDEYELITYLKQRNIKPVKY